MTNFYTRAEMEVVAERAAQKAIEKTFLQLGIDVSTPDAVLKAQRVITFGFVAYDTHNAIKNAGWRTGVGILVTAGAAVLLLGFKSYFLDLFRFKI